ncbi:MAG: metallophosphoesterase, partial [Melioribacteraceae bacterium]|nr:metallophosphoesterase [Melioribacteraceae bacterium]
VTINYVDTAEAHANDYSDSLKVVTINYVDTIQAHTNDSLAYFVPYTGATGNVNLGTNDIATEYLNTDTISGIRNTETDFTIIFLPDIQNMVEFHPAVWEGMCDWIKANKVDSNIVAVISAGDLTNDCGATQFAEAQKGFDTIKTAGIIYMPVIGNHDYPAINVQGRNTTMFNTYFGEAYFAGKTWYGDAYNDLTENYYVKFTQGTKNIIIIALEVFPRPEALTWAQGVINANPTYDVIITTHSYLNENGYRTLHNDPYGCDGYSVPPTQDAENMWNNFVKINKRILVIISAHLSIPNGTVITNDIGTYGNIVHQVKTDYQGEALGGGGKFMIFKFKPSTVTIETSVYSDTLKAFTADGASTLSLSPVFFNSNISSTYPIETTATIRSSSTIEAVGKIESQTNLYGLGLLYPKTATGLTVNSTGGLIASNLITANTGIIPDAIDGAYLGDATHQFSDLFIAEGGVIDFDNGDAQILQTNSLIEVNGADCYLNSGYFSLRLGANKDARIITNNAEKTVRFCGVHYTSDTEEPMGLIFANSTSTENILKIGGGTAYFNAASYISFFTAANNITTTGSERLRILADGKLGIMTTAPDKQIEINSVDGNNLRLTYNDANGTAANYVDLLTTSSGDLTITPSGGDITVNGNIAVTGTVDGRDVLLDGQNQDTLISNLGSGIYTHFFAKEINCLTTDSVILFTVPSGKRACGLSPLGIEMFISKLDGTCTAPDCNILFSTANGTVTYITGASMTNVEDNIIPLSNANRVFGPGPVSVKITTPSTGTATIFKIIIKGVITW